MIEKEKSRVVSQKEIKTVGVITSQSISKWTNIQKEVEKILGVENVSFFSFLDVDKQFKSSRNHFSEKSFNWQGDIQQLELSNFLEEPFDLLIGYFNKKNIFIESPVLQSKATFKVGISEVNQKLYEIEIAAIPSNIHNFLTELKKYLVLLNKMKN